MSRRAVPVNPLTRREIRQSLWSGEVSCQWRKSCASTTNSVKPSLPRAGSDALPPRHFTTFPCRTRDRWAELGPAGDLSRAELVPILRLPKLWSVTLTQLWTFLWLNLQVQPSLFLYCTFHPSACIYCNFFSPKVIPVEASRYSSPWTSSGGVSATTWMMNGKFMNISIYRLYTQKHVFVYKHICINTKPFLWISNIFISHNLQSCILVLEAVVLLLSTGIMLTFFQTFVENNVQSILYCPCILILYIIILETHSSFMTICN